MALIQMNSEQLDAAIATGQVVMVYFWTDWHEVCTEATETMEKVAKKYEGQAIVCSVNADQEGFRAIELGIYSIPTVILFQDCQEIDRISGMQPEGLYESLLNSCLHPEEINPYDLINSRGYL